MTAYEKIADNRVVAKNYYGYIFLIHPHSSVLFLYFHFYIISGYAVNCSLSSKQINPAVVYCNYTISSEYLSVRFFSQPIMFSK